MTSWEAGAPTLTPEACVADWDSVSYTRPTPHCLRRLDATKHYPEDVVGEVHADGEIWSRALWDIRTALGDTAGTTVIVEAQFAFAVDSSFRNAALATVAAAQRLYGTAVGQPGAVGVRRPGHSLTDSFSGSGGLHGWRLRSAGPASRSVATKGGRAMPSIQSEAVRTHWTMSRRAMEEPDDVRPDLESWGDLTAEPRGVDYIETDAGGVPAMWLVPKRSVKDRVLLCMHGGGYLSGSIYSHRKMFGHLAKAAGVRALIFDYRLAPAHVHPVQVDDAVTVYRWLLDQGVRADRVAFTGDSAGGGLSITAQLLARQRGLPLPAAAMPFSPWVDIEVTGDSYDTNRARDPFFHRDVVRGFADIFLGANGDPRDPLANPLYADLAGFGPIYIQVGADETLLDDARRLHEHARRAGVEASLDIVPDMLHTFQMAAGRAPEADEAIQRMADWVRPRLGLYDRHAGAAES